MIAARVCALAPALALFALGCGLDPLAQPSPCADGQRLPSGVCCPAWTTAAASSAGCVERAFSLPAAGDAVGEPGAREISVAVDSAGRGVAAWTQVDASGARLVVAEEQAGGGFALREPAAALPGRTESADLITGPDGTAAVAWKQWVDGGGVVFASERDASGAWADPPDLGARFSFPPTAYEPRLATRASGETVLVWNQWMSTGYGVAVARRPSAGAPWELPSEADDVLSPHIFFSNAPQIAVNERGDALIVWYQATSGPLMARASERFGPDGEFSRPAAEDFLSAPGAPVDSHVTANPMPALGPRGEAAVVWTQEDGAGAVPVYIATRDPEGRWTRPRDLSDSFSRALGIARCPQIAFGGAGELYVTWYQDDGEGNRVYGARRGSSGAWIEGGRSPILVSSEGAQGITPVLAVSASGAAVLVWSERAGEAWRVSARRTGPGEPWGPVEVLSPEGAGDAGNPAVAVERASGRTMVAWAQGEPLNARVLAAFVE